MSNEPTSYLLIYKRDAKNNRGAVVRARGEEAAIARLEHLLNRRVAIVRIEELDQ